MHSPTTYRYETWVRASKVVAGKLSISFSPISLSKEHAEEEGADKNDVKYIKTENGGREDE